MCTQHLRHRVYTLPGAIYHKWIMIDVFASRASVSGNVHFLGASVARETGLPHGWLRPAWPAEAPLTLEIEDWCCSYGVKNS